MAIYSDPDTAGSETLTPLTETTSVEIVIDDDGLLTAPEPKRVKKDDPLGKKSLGNNGR